MSEIKRFPFEYKGLLKVKDEMRTPFIDTVEKVLKSNIQDRYSFGCRISHCHTHAGSKAHFESFIEAELLFHNSYYNRGFAVLTYETIIRKRFKEESNIPIRNIVLIGYESYSELYLIETIRLLNDKLNKETRNEKIKCGYMIYETVVETKDKKRISKSRLRNLHKINGKKHLIYGHPNIHELTAEFKNDDKESICLEDLEDSTLFVFVVPINTTLTTMDKMYAKLKGELGIAFDNFSANCEFISLITLGGNKSNGYWYSDDFHKYLTIKKGGSLTSLPQNLCVYNYAYVDHEWLKRNNCKLCFPDKNGYNLTCEEPMFDTIKGSVVPMVRFGEQSGVAPFEAKIIDVNNKKINVQERNLKRVWDLTEFMVHKHIIRGGNHFQVYFDTAAYFNRYKKEVEDALREFKISNKNCKDYIYDYIVAPRHVTNAGLVSAVNSVVFGGEARIIYFDVDKEYRSNIIAKYSDLKNSVENIIKSGEKCVIRFHFVDDMIQSGATFMRVKSLMESILSEAKALIDGKTDSKSEIKLFDTIFLLINRISDNTLKSYICDFSNKWEEHVFSYTQLHISPMRNHDDACTLCRLAYDYENIMDRCATNNLADRCYRHIQDHEPIDIYTYLSGENKFKQNLHHEQKYLNQRLEVFLTHLLEVRLKNDWHISGEKTVDCESEGSDKVIKEILEKYYDIIEKKNNNTKVVISIFGKDINIGDFASEYKCAFIKAISRPFFIYHIRRRQAAFCFCLEQIDNMLKSYEEGIICPADLKLCKELVKALVNLKANYLIRLKILSRLEKLMPEKNNLYDKNELLFQIKGLIELADSQKSKLLETWLIDGEEDQFFAQRENKSQRTDGSKEGMQKKPFFINSEKEQGKDSSKFRALTFWEKLYLENSAILKNGFFDNNLDLKSYFLSDFKEICDYNCYHLDNKIFKAYNNVKNWLSEDSSLVEDSLDERLRDLLVALFEEKDVSKSEEDVLNDMKLDIISYVYNSEEKKYENKSGNRGNDLFKFALLSKKKDEISMSQKRKFFHDNHIKTLINIFERENGIIDTEDIIFYEDNTIIKGGRNSININSTQCVLIKFRKPNEKNESVFLEIRNFEKGDLRYWFALKIILTLRQFFVKYIKESNIENVKDERIADMRRAALASSVAGMHIISDQCHFKDLYLPHEGVINLKYLNNYFNKEKEDKFLYDLYFQYMSNSFISSLYRKIVRGDYDLIYSSGLVSCTPQKMLNEIISLWYVSSESLGDEFLYVMDGRYGTREIDNKKVFIRLKNINSWKEDCRACLEWVYSGDVRGTTLLFYLMAMNVISHADNENRDLSMDIVFSKDENYAIVEFSNYCECKNNTIEDYINIPPWLYYPQKAHSTLWSFNHAQNIMRNASQISFEIIYDSNYYKIKFKIPFIKIGER